MSHIVHYHHISKVILSSFVTLNTESLYFFVILVVLFDSVEYKLCKVISSYLLLTSDEQDHPLFSKIVHNWVEHS